MLHSHAQSDSCPNYSNERLHQVKSKSIFPHQKNLVKIGKDIVKL